MRAEYLPTGYGNGANLPDDGERLLERLGGWEAAHAERLRGHDILWMNGSDHLMPQDHLGRVVAEANRAAPERYHFEVTSLAAYLQDAPTDGLPTWWGELRSGARANLLMGVASNRTDVRRAAAMAERSLEQVAEPLLALYLPSSDWPAALLDEAWTLMIRNSAHDSICACSHDDVVDAVLHRFAEARQIADGLADFATRSLAATVAHRGPLAINPSARDRCGIVDLETETGRVIQDPLFMLPAESAVAVFGEMISWTTGMGNVVMSESDSGNLDVVVLMDGSPGEQQATPLVTARLAELVAEHPNATVRAFRQIRERLMVPTFVSVPGFGWAPVLDEQHHPVAVTDTMLANEHVTVVVSENGTWSLNGRVGFGRFVDGGDAGDTYNYSPPAHNRLAPMVGRAARVGM